MKPRYLLYAFRALCRKAYRLCLRKPLLVSPQERDNRLEKCRTCPHYLRHGIQYKKELEKHVDIFELNQLEKMHERCGICGCFLSLKTMFVDEACPDKNNPRW
jgi:hypothetical protein